MNSRTLRSSRVRRRRGFSLLEILFALLLLSVFAAIATAVFGSSMKVIRRSAQAETAIASAESAIRVLRGDVWDGQAFLAEGGIAVRITRSGGTARWFVDGEQALVRAFTPAGEGAPAHEQRWPELGGRMSFEATGPTVVARVAGQKNAPPAEVRMVSQVMLAREGKP